MTDKLSHTFTFKVEGVALSATQVSEIADAISGAAAGALLRHGHRGPRHPGIEKQPAAVYDWHGLEGIAGGIWVIEENLAGIEATRTTPGQVVLLPSAGP